MVTRERLLRVGMPAAVLGVAAATRLIALDQPGLREHLRASVINQLAIDQPTYPALATATASN